jgi:hypothetical protein
MTTTTKMMTKTKTQWHSDLYAKAQAAGRTAGERATPTPMIVEQHQPIQQTYHVPEGVCGFAWVRVRPGTCSFARWLKLALGCGRDYYGGMNIWITDHGQSLARKLAHAEALASVLREAGINATAHSRMD